jgi:2-oxoglutarate ferredoxin oxidoreductase subunit beta
MTVICMNNQIYGMTGGQGSPTTPRGAFSSTAPFGSEEDVFDLSLLAVAAGANYVARWTSYHVKELTKAIRVGLEVPGFSFIEAMVQCPTGYGRRNKLKEGIDMLEWMRSHSILLQKKERLEREGKTVPPDMMALGEIVRRERPPRGGTR